MSPKDSSDDDIKVEDLDSAESQQQQDQVNHSQSNSVMSGSSDFLGNQLANYFSQLFEKNQQTDSFIQKHSR